MLQTVERGFYGLDLYVGSLLRVDLTGREGRTQAKGEFEDNDG